MKMSQFNNAFLIGDLNYTMAIRIFSELEAINKQELSKLRNELYQYAIKYANIRAGWNFLSREERQDNEQARTAAHTVFIDSCNILSRAIIREGEGEGEITWRKEIGRDRKTIGDIACYLACFLGIKAR